MDQKSKKKVGRPKAKVTRKQTTFSLSAYQVKQFAKAEGRLLAEDINITRSRSQTAELAIALLQTMLDSEQHKEYALETIKQHLNFEENGFCLNE